MGSTRKPKGSYSRPTTDFFIAQCMIGGVFWSAGFNEGGVVELFNNATDGSSLHVYKIWTANDAAGPYYVTRQTGSQGGTVVPSYPVISSGAALPGIINYSTVTGITWTPGTPLVLPGIIATDNEAGTTDIWSAPGPLCVLLPGDSLRVVSPLGDSFGPGVVSATFYWAAFRDLG